MFVSITGLIIGLIYLLIYRRRTNQNELKKYRKAVKQSKKRQKQKDHLLVKNQQNKVRNLSSKRSTKAPHLRVIDGKKTTKKDPMSL